MTGDDFPEAPWSRAKVAPLLRPYYGFAGTRFGGRVIRAVAPVDDWLMRKSGGRITYFGTAAMRVLVLTTVGRKSGQRRENALTYMRDGTRLFVLGSNFGQAHHPGWTANLLNNPEASVTVGGTQIPVTAELLTGADRQHALDMFLTLAVYRRYTSSTDRELRLFALTRR